MRSKHLVLSAVAVWQLWVMRPTLDGQDPKQMEAILERLARLEAQNELLRREVATLREQMNPAGVPLPENVEAQRSQIQEQAQAKVEASARQPLAITGTLLMNAYWNGPHNAGAINSSTAALLAAPRTGGISFSQSIVGLRFRSPQTFLGADVSGSMMLDFFDANARSGSPPRQQSRHLMDYPRLRTANVELAWKNTSLSFGQEKPLISPRDPTSLAQVGVSPLTSAGNLWLWQPQVRLEQRFQLNDSLQLKAQGSVYQTAEDSAAVPAAFADTLSASRPGLQGRLSLGHLAEGEKNWEVATGFHASSTHVAAAKVPSRLISVDWFWKPVAAMQVTGTFFNGKNLANMGTLRQGFTILTPTVVRPIRSRGGWAQISYDFLPRLSANIYAGQHDDRNADLGRGQIGKNFLYAGNLIYRIATNVSISFEASQARTDYVGIGRRLKNHYDLALAYQF